MGPNMLHLKRINYKKNIFILCSYILIGIVISLFVEVKILQGRTDAPHYNNLAKKYAGITTEIVDIGQTSPLYPLFVALLIKTAGVRSYLNVLLRLQFVFLALAAYMMYILAYRSIGNQVLAYVFGILIVLNPQLVHINAQFNSEPLGILLACIYGLVLYRFVMHTGSKIWNLILLGLMSGLLILCRYNLIAIPIVTAIILLIEAIRTKDKPNRKWLNFSIWVPIYLLSVLFILNFWCFRNLHKFGEYSLFEMPGGTASRNAVLTILNENTRVSPEYEKLKDIIITANKSFEADIENRTEGRQFGSKYWPESLYAFKYGETGYMKYLRAEPELYKYFGIEAVSTNHPLLASKLYPFYQDIHDNNSGELIPLRILSAAYTLAPSNIKVIDKYKSIGNVFNSKLLQSAYVFSFVLVMLFLTVFSVLFVLGRMLKNWKNTSDTQWYIIYLTGIYFHFILLHAYRMTMKDSNRFKDSFIPLIFFTALYLMVYFYRTRRKAKRSIDAAPES
jgi:4-amino-4-deoxy-L-arabinose transferase-like glycosyltransferase